MTSRRSWFRLWVNGRVSQWAHSMAVVWERKEDGIPLTLCGVNPYDHAPDPRTVGFVSAKASDPRCEDCETALEAA